VDTESASSIMGCWAAAIGNCGGGISREHYVSECVFPDQSIFVKGLDFCLNEPRELRIESLTAKILCKDHNSGFSDLDAAAGEAFAAMRDFTITNTQRNKMPYLPWATQEFPIDGPRLERWCLKTLLNFSFTRTLIVGPGCHDPGIVPVDLVRIAYGLEEFTDGRGLYTAFRDHETFDLSPSFGYTAKANGPNLAMAGFRLYGFRFYLNLEPQPFPYTGIEDSHVFYRKASFAQKYGDKLSHRLSIVWP
jgi:hypothetical protein